MKKTVLFLLLSVSCAWAQTNEFTVPEGTLTLRAARRIALDNNPGVIRALRNIEASQAVLQQTRSLWFPTISASGSYARMDVDKQLDWKPSVRYADSFDDSTASIQARWLLFDGFSRRANILSSKFGVEQAEQLHSDARRLLLDSVTMAYMQSQRAIEGMAVAAQDLAFNRQLESDSRKRYDAGAVPEADLLNFSVRALQAETQFMQARRNYQIACTVLAQLMALPDAKLPPDLQPMRIGRLDDVTLPDDDDEIAYALQHRPDLLALAAGRQALHQQVNAKKGAYAPQVALVAGMEYENRADTAYVDMNNRDSYAGVTFQWDLFTGGRNSGKVREAAAQLAALEETSTEATLNVQSSIRQTLETARVAEGTWQRNQQAAELTLRIRESVAQAYQAGAASLTRLNEAQTDLTRASGAAAVSRIDFFQTLENLAAQTGRILEPAAGAN
jgi:outer membrane protein TolC